MFDYFTRGMGAEVEQPMRWIQEQDSWLRGRCAAGDGQPGGAGDEARFWQARRAGPCCTGTPPDCACPPTAAGPYACSKCCRHTRAGKRLPSRSLGQPAGVRAPTLCHARVSMQSVCLLLRQFDGLKDGYRAAAASADDAAAIGDMSDWVRACTARRA